jgi:hypothetical protein
MMTERGDFTGIPNLFRTSRYSAMQKSAAGRWPLRRRSSPSFALAKGTDMLVNAVLRLAGQP